jgi:hypothetical protein
MNKITTPSTADSDIISKWIGDNPGRLGNPRPVSGDPCAPICGDCCGLNCCDSGCGCCQDRGRFWFRGEYLLMAIQHDNVPPLVTFAPTGLPGVLGQPGTVVAFGGGGNLDNGDLSGGRFTVGLWCCRHPDLGLEATYFFLGRRNSTFFAGSDGGTSIGRPLNVANVTFDNLGRPVPPGENVEQVALAGSTKGNVTVATSSQLWGTELNARYQWCCGPCWHIDFLGGFRYLDLNEKIDINEMITTVADGSMRAVSDRFGTRNDFYGGQIGLDGEWRWRRWFFGTTLKLALGDMHEFLRIEGNTVFVPPAPATPVNRNGGVLALASNIGTYSKDRLAVIPEVGVKVGYQITSHLRVFAGYDFLAVSDVLRPGDQIDRRVNTNQFPNIFADTKVVQPALPAVPFRDTGFWAQGLNAGLEFRY